MSDFLLDYPLLIKIYRSCRSVILILAALYIVMATLDATRYRVGGTGVATFALQTLKADVVDVASVIGYKLFGYSLGVGFRPMKFALICEETGQLTEAENADAEQRVRRQLVQNSGDVYNSMIAESKEGYAQPVFILSKYGLGGAKLWTTWVYDRQECTCSGKYNATERSRIPASDFLN